MKLPIRPAVNIEFQYDFISRISSTRIEHGDFNSLPVSLRATKRGELDRLKVDRISTRKLNLTNWTTRKQTSQKWDERTETEIRELKHSIRYWYEFRYLRNKKDNTYVVTKHWSRSLHIARSDSYCDKFISRLHSAIVFHVLCSVQTYNAHSVILFHRKTRMKHFSSIVLDYTTRVYRLLIIDFILFYWPMKYEHKYGREDLIWKRQFSSYLKLLSCRKVVTLLVRY